MTVQAFTDFANGLDFKSPEFLDLARSVASPADLAAYAGRQGFALTADEADALIDGAKRELDAKGIAPLSGDDLENVVGGISWQAIVGGGAAAIGGIAAACVALPAIATGATAGFVAGMIGGSTVISGGLGSMAGALVDLIKGD